MNRSIGFLFALTALPLAVGCGQLNEDDARVMWGSVEDGLGVANGAGQALSIDASFDVECRHGGSAMFDGALDIEADSPGTTASTFTYDVTFDECANDDNKLDGEVQYAAALGTEFGDGMASFDLVYTYRGQLVVQGESNGACDFDVRGAVTSDSTFGDGSFGNTTTVLYTGTLCGHDAEDVLDDRYESHINKTSTINIDINP